MPDDRKPLDGVEARVLAQPEPDLTDPDNPEWTADDFDRARPAREVMGEAFMEKVRRPPGRPKSDAPKVPVSLRLDPDLVQRLKAGGPGWQTRVNEALARLVAAGEI